MGTHYSHISLCERRRIGEMPGARMPVPLIAKSLGRHRSTVHREISRNFYHTSFRDRWGKPYRGYHCLTAHQRAVGRRSRRRKLVLRPELLAHVLDRLRAGWSPQQVAGRPRVEPLGIGRVSHETIYGWVYGPEGRRLNLHALLATARRRRRRRMGRKPRQGPVPQERWIASRPPEVAGREEFGHWEGDLLIFARPHGKSNVTSLVERKTRYLVLLANEDRRSAPVAARIGEALGSLPAPARRTVTFDRGTEFMGWRALPLDAYFCDPHSPWQKGAVENANGIARRFLPLASAPGDRSPGALKAIADQINATPRKSLGYRTPEEVFAACLASSRRAVLGSRSAGRTSH